MICKESCNLCGSSEIKRLYALKDDYISIHEDCDRILHVEKCRKCGLIFISNVEDIDKVHETFWKEIIKDKSIEFEGVSSSDYEGKVLLMDKYRDKNRVLDIGCGDGQFLKILKDRGWNEFGIEVTKDVVLYAREELGLNVVQGVAEDIDFSENYFDVVIMWGVIEHLKDPQRVLQKINKILRGGGLLLIYTPNANSLFHKLARLAYLCSAGKFKYPLCKLFMAMHLYYFTPKTISKMLVNNELVTLKILKENIDLNIIFATCADRQFVRNSVIKNSIKGISFLSSALRMQSHMVVYAVSKKN